MSDTENLRELAQRATPGPWRAFGMQLRAPMCPERCADLDHSVLLADFYTVRDGHPRAFDLDLAVRAASPNRILALLDERDRLLTEVAELKARLGE